MKKLKIVLGDLSYDTPLMKGNLYTPLGAGYLAAYTHKIYGDRVDIKIFKEPSALLDYATREKPDLIGLSHYFWNSELNRMVTRRLRNEHGNTVTVVWGGPSIETDPEVLLQTCLSFPDVDYFVPDEGELGFANIVESLLSGSTIQDQLDGVVFEREGLLVSGKSIGLTTDLSTVDSPYLSGLLDSFLNSEHLPLLQTSRLCPYTCAYCVSGKNVGKLRSFPIDQIKAEIEYISERYKNLPNHMLYISDDNLGILDRDADIARYIRKVSQRSGWPKKVKYYSDKKFGKKAREVQSILGDMNFHGVMLSLQTANPDTLEIIKRRNMSIDQFNDAIAWARSRKLPLSTELIFGLPMETRKSFLDLIDKCVELKIDSIQCYNLIMCDGAELSRPSSRRKNEIKTRFRHISGSYTYLGEDFCAETEEVAVGARGYDMDDFRFFRVVSLLLFCTSYLRMHTLFFGYLKQLGIPFSGFIEKLFDIANAADAGHELSDFIAELKVSIDAELFDTRKELIDHLRRLSEDSGGNLPEPFKINPEFGCRMVQHSDGWVLNLLRRILSELYIGGDRQRILETADFLLELGAHERVAGEYLYSSAPLETEYDVVAWRSEGFCRPLDSYCIPKCHIEFIDSPALSDMRESLSAKYNSERVQQELYKNLRSYQLAARELVRRMVVAK